MKRHSNARTGRSRRAVKDSLHYIFSLVQSRLTRERTLQPSSCFASSVESRPSRTPSGCAMQGKARRSKLAQLELQAKWGCDSCREGSAAKSRPLASRWLSARTARACCTSPSRASCRAAQHATAVPISSFRARVQCFLKQLFRILILPFFHLCFVWVGESVFAIFF